MSLIPTGQRAKALGEFYTGPAVAGFLSWWEPRTEKDTVVDPSFGGGIFLRSAAKRLRAWW